MFTFYVKNQEPFWALTKNGPKLDKNKIIVFRVSVFVVYKSAVSSTQKWMFVFAHVFPDISIKSTKLHFQSWKIIFANDFAFFF